MIAVVGVVIGSITRGAWLQRAIVRQRTTGDHQPLCGSGSNSNFGLAVDSRLRMEVDCA